MIQPGALTADQLHVVEISPGEHFGEAVVVNGQCVCAEIGGSGDDATGLVQDLHVDAWRGELTGETRRDSGDR